MPYIAGVDIGNNSTEVAIAEFNRSGGAQIVSSSIVKTVGIKGTVRNVLGVIDALDRALSPLGIPRKDLDIVLLNEATPVIGDVAMETITETVITESAMIGHNPATPGGMGLALGTTIMLEDMASASPDKQWIVIIPGSTEFRVAAEQLNRAMSAKFQIAGAIVQKDDGVLIHNRLHHINRHRTCRHRQPVWRCFARTDSHLRLGPAHMPQTDCRMARYPLIT